MAPKVKLISNHDGTYDIILEYTRADIEFAEEFNLQKSIQSNSKQLSEKFRSFAKKAKIKSVKIIVSGVLVASVAFSSFLTAFAATDRYIMGYLYSGTDKQQVEFVNQTNNALDTVSPSYFDLQEDGSLKLNYVSKYLIESMHEKGIKVVPFLSNHWNRTAGINALQDVETLSTQIAQYIEEYHLDGVNVDIENVTHEQRDQYTQLVKLLREKVPENKEISVAVAANPNDWQTGWHGSYDYAALAQYADHLLIMAYDEHYEGGTAGPVASVGFVENSIKYALNKTTSDKIVIGIPFYGRIWGLDSGRINGKGISNKTIQSILADCDATVTYDEQRQSVKAEFEITESNGKYTVGGDFVLEPGRYVVWYENDQSYQAKMDLIQKYNLKGAGAWALGQEDPSIWDHYEDWVNGEDDEETEPSIPTDPSQPEEPDQSEPVLPDDPTPVPPSDEDAQEPSEPSQPPVSEPEYFIHEVKSGDTLWKISAKYLGQGSRYPEIMQLNGLTGDRIYPGMQLKIPGIATDNSPDMESKPEVTYREYTVKRGDSLWKIARNQLGAGKRYTEIKELNGLEGDMIYPGQVLKLPR